MSRNSGLDYLRSLAVVIVLANHCFLWFFVSTGKIVWQGGPAYLSASAVISIEWLFVLSGYLIGTMMIRIFEKEQNHLSACRDFWLRRWFRTLPCYYLFLLVNVGLSMVLADAGSFDWSYVFFLQNLAYPEKLPHFFGESWSLAVDEWFYLIMPILVLVSARLMRLSVRNAFLLSSLLLITLPFWMRLMHEVPRGFFQWDAEIRRLTIYHLDATGWGVLAATLSRWAPEWWQRQVAGKAALGLVITVLGLAAIWKLVHSGWGSSATYSLINAGTLSLLGLGTLLLLPAIVRLKAQKGWAHTAVARISLYSYTLYLSHFPLLLGIRAVLGLQANSPWPVMALAVLLWLALVWLVSVLVFHFFEKPVADVREKITRRVDATPFGARA
ncbi:acyltransferase family protein [Pseudomonas paralcaligenes]|uniref:acyltransferase family protein n=1 Tax=Pseudomonas paralcaligenes TaxID=2772558 RepID=UPI001C80F43C|nr:acyltransferase [Pseudomonas paralcaligenes]